MRSAPWLIIIPPAKRGQPSAGGSVEPAAAQTGQGDNSTGAAAGATDGAPAGDSPAAVSSNNTAGAGPDSSAGESSGHGETVKSERLGGSQGSGPATWILAIAALVLIAAGYVISRRRK